jgi:hypothetical protein
MNADPPAPPPPAPADPGQEPAETTRRRPFIATALNAGATISAAVLVSALDPKLPPFRGE